MKPGGATPAFTPSRNNMVSFADNDNHQAPTIAFANVKKDKAVPSKELFNNMQHVTPFIPAPVSGGSILTPLKGARKLKPTVVG